MVSEWKADGQRSNKLPIIAPINKEKAAPDKMHIMTTKIMKARDAGVGSIGLPMTLFRNSNARKLPKRNVGSKP